MKTSLSRILVAVILAAAAQAADVNLSITGISNSAYVGIMPSFPSGIPLLGGITFDLPASRPSWGSNRLGPDASVALPTNVPNVGSVHLLLHTGNTYADEMSIGNEVGHVTLSFGSGATQIVPLLVGVNIREWAIGVDAGRPVINTLTDPNAQEVWRGNNNGGVLCAINMLTIPVSEASPLTAISITDQSGILIGRADPEIDWLGATVQTVPEPSAIALTCFGLLGTALFRRYRCIGKPPLINTDE